MLNERYYYSIMTREQRRVYKKIYEGLKQREYTIDISAYFSTEEIQELYLRVLFDNPLFYYVNQTVIRLAGSLGCYVLLPEYLYSQKEIMAINNDIRTVIKKIDEKANVFINNQFRLEKFLHDSVVKSVAYDYDSLMKNDCFNAHSIVGAFLENKAVCEGIAKAFKVLCNEYQIKCIVVLGKADPMGVFDGNSYHAWNLVKIQDNSYHVDPTWDNMFHDGLRHISYDYFNVTTEEILLDHQPIGELPLCTANSLNYFVCTHSIVDSMQSLKSLITQRKNRETIMFKYRIGTDGFSSFKEAFYQTYIVIASLNQHMSYGRKYKILFNERQAICKLIFDT